MKFLFFNGRIRIFPLLGLLLVFGGIILAAFWFMVPMVSAYYVTPAPAQEYMWSYVEIAKPSSYVSLPVNNLPAGTPIGETASIIENTSTAVPADNEPAQPIATETPAQLSMEVVTDAPAPVYADLPSNPYGGSKYILVDISEQHMYVYEGDQLIYSFVASTGMNNLIVTSFLSHFFP